MAHANSSIILQNKTLLVNASPTTAGYSQRHRDEAQIYLAVNSVLVKLIIAVSSVGIIQQILALLALKCIKGRSRPMHKFITSLAVAELLFLIEYLAQNVADLTKTDINNCIMSLLLTADHMFISAAELSILAMVIDQYFAICHPLRYQVLISGRVVKVMLVLVWLVSFITSIWQFLSVETLRKVDYGYTICLPDVIDSRWEKVFKSDKVTAHLHVVVLLIAVVVIILFYCKIFYIAFTNLRGRGNSYSSENASASRKHLKTALTAFLLFATLLVLWLPYWVIRIASLNSHFEGRLPFWITVIVYNFLVTLNPIFDSLIYGIRISEIRGGYRRLFTILRCSRLCQMAYKRQSLTSSTGRTESSGARSSSIEDHEMTTINPVSLQCLKAKRNQEAVGLQH